MPSLLPEPKKKKKKCQGQRSCVRLYSRKMPPDCAEPAASSLPSGRRHSRLVQESRASLEKTKQKPFSRGFSRENRPGGKIGLLAFLFFPVIYFVCVCAWHNECHSARVEVREQFGELVLFTTGTVTQVVRLSAVAFIPRAVLLA